MTGAPSFCIKGCGFFSTSQTKNLCSKCYNDFLKDESARYLATLSLNTGTAKVAEETQKVAATEAEETQEVTATEAVMVKKKSSSSRCKACKKKVGLLGFQCRCGGVFYRVDRWR